MLCKKIEDYTHPDVLQSLMSTPIVSPINKKNKNAKVKFDIVRTQHERVSYDGFVISIDRDFEFIVKLFHYAYASKSNRIQVSFKDLCILYKEQPRQVTKDKIDTIFSRLSDSKLKINVVTNDEYGRKVEAYNESKIIKSISRIKVDDLLSTLVYEIELHPVMVYRDDKLFRTFISMNMIGNLSSYAKKLYLYIEGNKFIKGNFKKSIVDIQNSMYIENKELKQVNLKIRKAFAELRQKKYLSSYSIEGRGKNTIFSIERNSITSEWCTKQ